MSFEVKKMTGAWGRIALHCKGYRGGPNINRHPLAKQQGPEEPLPRRTDKAHGTHMCSVKATNNNDAKTLASSGVQVHKVCSLMSATVMILPQVHLRKPCYDFYFL